MWLSLGEASVSSSLQRLGDKGCPACKKPLFPTVFVLGIQPNLNYSRKGLNISRMCVINEPECEPMPIVMAALPNIGGALYLMPQFGWHPLLECRSVTLPRRKTRWNLQGCPKLRNRTQLLVSRSSPYYEDLWRRYWCLTSFFPIVNICLSSGAPARFQARVGKDFLEKIRHKALKNF